MNSWSQIRFVVLAAVLAGIPGRSFAVPGQSFAEAKKHWAYQPIQSPTPPKVKNQRRVQSPIDAFLLAKLEEKNLSFAPPADKRTLLRRVYFNLIGLPPTMEEQQAFELDHSGKAFAILSRKIRAHLSLTNVTSLFRWSGMVSLHS